MAAPHAPSPPGHWLLGNFRDFRQDALGFLTATARGVGDLSSFRIGPARVHLVNHPRLVREIVVDRAEEFEKSPLLKDVFGRLVGDGVICADGEQQKKQRRLIMPALHYKRVNAYAPLFADGAERAARRWESLAECEIGQEMFTIAFGAMARALFGIEASGLHDTMRAAMIDMQESFQALFSSPVPLPQWVPTPTNLQLKRTVDRVDAIVRGLIAEKRRTKKDEGDFLSMLVLGEDGKADGMSDAEVLDEAKTLFLAGFETTVYLLLWTWLALAENADVEARVLRELDAVLGGRAPGADDVKRLPYVGNVLQEALRMYPPVWAFNRAPAHDTTVEGYAIAKGEMVLVCPYLLQHDPRFFAEPERFDPDRFATPPDKYAFIPFGIGPRSCIGAQFALMEATIILATLAPRFHLSVVPGQDTRPVAYPSLRPRDGIRMRIARRTSAAVAATA